MSKNKGIAYSGQVSVSLIVKALSQIFAWACHKRSDGHSRPERNATGIVFLTVLHKQIRLRMVVSFSG
jgi:hypothetical protein